VNKRIGVLLMGALLAFGSVGVQAEISNKEKKQIEQIVHDYLLSNPEVLIEASQALQKKQQESMVKQANSAIEQNGKELFSAGPMIGNPKGSVTIVEFFDYQCVHCKKMEPIMSALVEKDKN
jgi:protein-disulfide isomerase